MVNDNTDEMYRIDSINSASRRPQPPRVTRHATLAPIIPTTPVQDPNVMDWTNDHNYVNAVRPPPICYNCQQPDHIARVYTNPTVPRSPLNRQPRSIAAAPRRPEVNNINGSIVYKSGCIIAVFP